METREGREDGNEREEGGNEGKGKGGREGDNLC